MTRPPHGPPRTWGRSRGGLLILSLAISATGCRAAPEPAPPPVFYPPPPAPPRVQFLRSLVSSDDVVPRPDAFMRFVLGEDARRSATRLVRPYGMAMQGGKLYVCDSGARTGVIFDFARKSFRSFGQEGAYRLGLPVNVSLGPGGEKFIVDPERAQILVLGANDVPVRALAGPREMRPCDAVFYDRELFVTDLKTNSIYVLDPRSGRVLRQFGKSGSAPGEFFQPTNLAVGPKGHLYVSDTLNARVQKLDRQGRVLKVIGSRGRAMGQMVRPKGVAVDRAGRLYVCDAAAESVQMYDAEGRYLMSLGRPGVGRGDLSLPAEVALSYDGVEYFAEYAAPGFTVEHLIFVSSHLGPNKINVYGFGTRLPPSEGGRRTGAPGASGLRSRSGRFGGVGVEPAP